MELAKQFDPKSVEERWFQRWVDAGYFRAAPELGGEAFSMVIPPPNVTGQLHLGHALNVTLQDIIVRTRRMQGFNTLWLPGTDHAGIATQNVVERELAKQGTTRHELGREAFVARVWQWRETYGRRILHQLRRLGASCDWSRERFTLDPALSRAVVEVFVRLYEEGLIYRGRRLINWCIRCATALSDLEVDHLERSGTLYYVRYPFAEGDGWVTVATTRPETMLGDSAVAVHPEDRRWSLSLGRRLKLPLLGRELPVIADGAVEPQFGTGAVKVTPAHDPADFEIGRRHGLAEISVIDQQGRMVGPVGAYAGLSREQCRERVVDDLKAQGFLEKTEPHRHAVGVCSRCQTVVEPLLSEQWFVRTRALADNAIGAVEQGRTIFFPRFWENTYFAWMRNIHDWCISRQLWWGHRIPAYWCEGCGALTVARERPGRCERCGAVEIRQDEDVLDTWFSSALWPFSTMGWPEQTADLARYYPTTVLITGFDIIFFWVARMLMMGLKFMGEVPFRHVYITPLVRDQHGKKMTKSRGNVVDVLEIVDRYGSDAVRFALAQLAVQGRDLVLSPERLAAARAFANKVWNAARFVFLSLEDAPRPTPAPEAADLDLAERWVCDELSGAVAEVAGAIERYEFNNAALAAHRFVWHRFCDWYIELSKPALRLGGARKLAAQAVLVHCLDRSLRLLHPFMPFITEEIWQVLRPFIGEPQRSDHLAVARFPEPSAQKLLSEEEAVAMAHCIEAAEAVNSLRALVGHHPGNKIKAWARPVFLPAGVIVDSPAQREALFGREARRWEPYLFTMAKLESLELLHLNQGFPAGSVAYFLGWGEVGIQPPPDFDPRKARHALAEKLNEVRVHLQRHRERLADPNFHARAGEETISQTYERQADLQSQQSLLERQLSALPGEG